MDKIIESINKFSDLKNLMVLTALIGVWLIISGAKGEFAFIPNNPISQNRCKYFVYAGICFFIFSLTALALFPEPTDKATEVSKENTQLRERITKLESQKECDSKIGQYESKIKQYADANQQLDNKLNQCNQKNSTLAAQDLSIRQPLIVNVETPELEKKYRTCTPKSNDSVALRKNPHVKSDEIMEMKQNTSVYLIQKDTTGKWFYVKTDGNQMGWAYSGYLCSVPPTLDNQ